MNHSMITRIYAMSLLAYMSYGYQNFFYAFSYVSQLSYTWSSQNSAYFWINISSLQKILTCALLIKWHNWVYEELPLKVHNSRWKIYKQTTEKKIYVLSRHELPVLSVRGKLRSLYVIYTCDFSPIYLWSPPVMGRLRDVMSRGEATEDEEADEPLLPFPPGDDSMSGSWAWLHGRHTATTTTSWSWSNRIKGRVFAVQVWFLFSYRISPCVKCATFAVVIISIALRVGLHGPWFKVKRLVLCFLN